MLCVPTCALISAELERRVRWRHRSPRPTLAVEVEHLSISPELRFAAQAGFARCTRVSPFSIGIATRETERCQGEADDKSPRSLEHGAFSHGGAVAARLHHRESARSRSSSLELKSIQRFCSVASSTDNSFS
jgi:hypothetical protein